MKNDATFASACPACGGTLLFDAGSGKMKCEFCLSEFTPEEVEAAFREKEAKTLETGAKDVSGEESMDDGMKGYTCSTCGAELMADMNTAVMICPYCGNHTIAPAQFSGSIRPDYIIPFAHTKKEAEDKYRAYYEKRFLLPKDFKTDNHVEEIQGVYVPFWLFSGRGSIDARYLAHDESTDKDGHTHVTGRFDEVKAGYLDYEKVPADASKRMEDDLMDSIEPYQMTEMKEFSMVYLPGFLAERFDVSEDECQERARKRVKGSLSSEAQKSIKRDEIDKSVENFRFEGERSNYAMMPVWRLVTKWKDKTYKFAMNGQTGKMIGDLPMSAPKVLAILIPILAAFIVIGALLFGDAEHVIEFLIAGVIVDAIVFAIMYGSMKPVKLASEATNYISTPFTFTKNEEKRVNAIEFEKIRKELNQMKAETTEPPIQKKQAQK